MQDSIVGHGRRRKQAHDEHHDWIGIRRGLCNRCGKTFTFLPPFSPPYGHYSFIARSQALQRYFLEGRDHLILDAAGRRHTWLGGVGGGEAARLGWDDLGSEPVERTAPQGPLPKPPAP